MKYLLSFLLICVCCSLAVSQIALNESQVTKLDSLTTRDVPEGAPGIATAIISKGELIYESYAGFEELTTYSKIDSHSRFNIASNGKQFTALAILMLESEGKIKLTDDIRKYLPTIYPENPFSIEIKHLLTQTSGIRDFYDLLSLQGITWWEKTYSKDDVVKIVERQTDLNFEPGTDYLYSNTNYILLAQIIEKVTKQSFVEYTNKMFAKLQMNDTSFEDDYKNIRGPVAHPYFNFDTWQTYDWKWNVVGDGNLFTTLSDQIQWEKVIDGKSYTSIAREVIKKSQELNKTHTKFDYGYGLEFDNYRGIPYRFHEGATGAWKATVVRLEEKDLTIVTMTNSGKTIPSQQTREMIDIVLDLSADSNSFLTQPDKLGPKVNEEDILGIYVTPTNFAFEFRKKENGTLVLYRSGRGETEIVRESANVFHQKYDPAFKQEFIKNANGEMLVTAYYTTHAPYSLVRPIVDWVDYDFKSLNGHYFNNETRVHLTINHLNNREYEVFFNNQKQTATLLEPGKLLVNNDVIEFERNESDVSTLFLSGSRIRNIRFGRKPQ